MKRSIRKISIMGIGIIALGIGITAGVVHKRLVEKPVYYRYLMERYLPTEADSVTETCTTEVRYITSFNDKKEVTNVTFEGDPELKVEVSGQTSERYGIYQVVTVKLYMEWEQSKEVVLPSVAEISQIQVEYSDKSSQMVDIGRLCIYSGESSEQFLEAVDCMPLFDSERLQTYETKQELQIKGFSESTRKSIEMADIIESLSLTCKGEDITNLKGQTKAAAESQLEFKMYLRGTEKNRLLGLESDYDYYEIEPQILYCDKEGREYFTTVFNFPVVLSFSDGKDVRQYLKRRAEF